MDDKQETIGLTKLLDEVNRDLDDLRRKHPNDYSLKNLDLWWELERERVLTRHGPDGSVRRPRRIRGGARTLALFTAGWATMIVLQAAIRLVVG